ncbi:MAG: glycosyltransferase [Caldilineaceae bacterium]|nr:glycosyltransferase [Caldilineaceae bacterium]
MTASIIQQLWAEWQLFCRYANLTQATQSLVMYLDRFQLPLALGLPVSLLVSGIYFRPKLHYSQLPGTTTSFKQQCQQQRERLLWRRAFRHPRFQTLFCLDALAVAPLQALTQQRPVLHLPDPVASNTVDSASAVHLTKAALGIAEHRHLFLLFGVLDSRKGIYQLLDALRLLPDTALSKLAILFVGPIAQRDTARFSQQCEAVRTAKPAVQLLVWDRYIHEEEIQPFFTLADVILAPYQQHVGMSGIVVRAAAARKPLLAAQYGLMGAIVRQHQLGLTLDTTQPAQIAAGITEYLERSVTDQFDPDAASNFATANTPARFVEVLAKGLGLAPPWAIDDLIAA